MTNQILSLAALATLALAAPSAAQDRDREREPAYSGPAFGVGRVSLTDRDVRVQRPSGSDFRAQAGTALIKGDEIATGSDSRAEIQFDHSNFLRLSSDTRVRIGELGNKRFQVELLSGRAAFSQLPGGEADVEIETAQASVIPLKPSVFTVERFDQKRTDVTVRNGAVEVAAGRRVERVGGGAVSIHGEGSDSSIRSAKAEPKDRFDEWNKRRDKLMKQDSGRRYAYGPPLWYPSFGLGFGYGRGYGYSGRGFRGGGRVVVARGSRGRRR